MFPGGLLWAFPGVRDFPRRTSSLAGFGPFRKSHGVGDDSEDRADHTDHGTDG